MKDIDTPLPKKDPFIADLAFKKDVTASKNRYERKKYGKENWCKKQKILEPTLQDSRT